MNDGMKYETDWSFLDGDDKKEDFDVSLRLSVVARRRKFVIYSIRPLRLWIVVKITFVLMQLLLIMVQQHLAVSSYCYYCHGIVVKLVM